MSLGCLWNLLFEPNMVVTQSQRYSMSALKLETIETGLVPMQFVMNWLRSGFDVQDKKTK